MFARDRASALSAAVQLSQRHATGVYLVPSAGQVAGGALGQNLGELSVDLIRRGMNRAPTISIRQGTPFLIALQSDPVFPGPYREIGLAR